MSKLFGTDWISRKYIERYPNSKRTKSWYGKIVAINCCSGWWKANSCGYTYRPNAGAYLFEDALFSSGSGKERMNTYHLHSVITDENHNFDPSGRRKRV